MSRSLRWLTLALILIAAAGLRLWHIDTIPPGFHFDEAFEGLEAWRILVDPGYRPVFLTGNFGVLPLNAYANALMFGLVQALGSEAGPTAMRMTAACFGVLGVASVYLLAQELRQLEPALPATFPLLAAGSLALMRWHIHFSRMGIEPVIVPALWAGAMGLLLRGWRTGSLASFLGAGTLLAACLYTYQGAWVIPPLTLLLVAHLALMSREHSRGRWRGLLLGGVLWLLLAAPLLAFFAANPDLLLLRPGQIALVGQGGSPDSATPLANLWAAVRMFSPIGSPGDLDPRRNLPGAPALNLWQLLPFAVGLVLALRRLARPAYLLLLTGLLGLILPGVFSEYMPHFHRILGAAAPTALLCGLGLAWLWQRQPTSRTTGFGPYLLQTGAPLAVVTLLLLGGLTSAHNYFQRWAQLPDLFHAFDAGLWQIGQWVADQPAETPIYLTPRDAGHPTLAFAWRPASGSRPAPTTFDGRKVFPLTARAATQAEYYLVIEHEDFRSQLLLPEIFPSYKVEAEILDGNGQVYARRYLRPAGSQPAIQPQQMAPAVLGDGIHLLGYDLIPRNPRGGGLLFVRLYWEVDETPRADWTVFTHLLGPPAADSNPLWAGKDSPPGDGSLSTSRWLPGWQVVDEYEMALPSELPPGTYQLKIGLYHADGRHLPAQESGLLIGSVQVEVAS